jgi:hypothetical protein
VSFSPDNVQETGVWPGGQFEFPIVVAEAKQVERTGRNTCLRAESEFCALQATLGVLTVLARIVSFGILSGVRSVGRVVSVVGSVLLLLSGAYVVYHWLTAGRFLLA